MNGTTTKALLLSNDNTVLALLCCNISVKQR
jgi:hypothetical protein